MRRSHPRNKKSARGVAGGCASGEEMEGMRGVHCCCVVFPVANYAEFQMLLNDPASFLQEFFVQSSYSHPKPW